MNVLRLRIALVLPLLLLKSCSHTAPRTIQEMSIERTGCTDPCPAYRAVLRRDGVVEYFGNDRSDRPGTWRGYLPPRDFAELADFIAQQRFFEMDGRYGAPGLHFGPVVTTVVLTNGDVKRVENYGFYQPAGPLRLQWIEAAIDTVIERRVDRWEVSAASRTVCQVGEDHDDQHQQNPSDTHHPRVRDRSGSFCFHSGHGSNGGDDDSETKPDEPVHEAWPVQDARRAASGLGNRLFLGPAGGRWTTCSQDPGNRRSNEPLTMYGMTSFVAASCPYCGEPVEISVDEGGGHRQSYVEDCPVCCQPWQVEVSRHSEDDWSAALRTTDE